MIKSSVIIGIMAVIIIVLLINIYQQNQQMNMLQKSCQETMVTVGCKQPTQNSGITASNPPQNQNMNRIVLYYANWCGFCQQLLPIWAAFEQRNAGKLLIEKVDCENSKCDVAGFPTVKYYKINGDVINFDGPRTVAGLENFIANN